MLTNIEIIGVWGFGDSSRGTGRIVCLASDAEAVRAAYDAIDESDSGPNVLASIEAAGGNFVRDEMDLVDSETGETIRKATDAEAAESVMSGPEGHILVDGRRCYVAH